MTKSPFADALVPKSERALQVAKLALNAGDNDGAVSRSYYAMFDIARAAILRAGVAEDTLPRTHSGVIEAFRRHAVQSGQIAPQLATQLRKNAEATEVVQNAGLFVQTVVQVFSLDGPSIAKDYGRHAPKDDDKVSEPAANLVPISLEEIRRQARENWLQLQQHKVDAVKGAGASKVVDPRTEAGRGHTIDDDADE